MVVFAFYLEVLKLILHKLKKFAFRWFSNRKYSIYLANLNRSNHPLIQSVAYTTGKRFGPALSIIFAGID